jgi:hypothetical protein
MIDQNFDAGVKFHYGRVLEAYERCLSEDPDYVDAHFNQGWEQKGMIVVCPDCRSERAQALPTPWLNGSKLDAETMGQISEPPRRAALRAG